MVLIIFFLVKKSKYFLLVINGVIWSQIRKLIESRRLKKKKNDLNHDSQKKQIT